MKKILLAGEGENDLGGWSKEIAYRDENPRDGVVCALLRKARGDGWKISDAIVWSKIRKYKSGDHRARETRAVIALALDAKERGFDVLAFVRDSDGYEERELEIAKGIEEGRKDFPAIAGAVAVQRIESWILATFGEKSTEGLSNSKVDEALKTRGVEAKHTRAMVDAITDADFTKLPQDARSLSAFLEQARLALG